jgi:signal peptidase II
MTNLKANRSYRRLFWSLALLSFTVDQVSKYGVFAWLYEDRPRGAVEVIPGAFQIVAGYTAAQETGTSRLSFLRTISGQHLPEVNQGALFGTKFGFSPEAGNLLFTVVSIVAAAGIIYWSTRARTAHHRFLCLALGLILGGTLGNLYDRTVFNGVRDFLYWYKYVDWPVFNIADCCLVCGAGLLLLEAFFAKAEPLDQRTPVAAVSNANFPF